MANLIITVIAIALVAIASLMGAYYGGSAFLNNQSAANASTVLNQAQQIAGAWNAYLSDNLNAPPGDAQGGINALTTGNYLAQIPTAPAGANGAPSQAMSVGSANATINGATALHYFAYANLGVPAAGGATMTDNNFAACGRVVKTAIGSTAYGQLSGNVPTFDAGKIFNGTGGNGTFGCAVLGTAPTVLKNSTTPTAGDYVMEYLLQ